MPTKLGQNFLRDGSVLEKIIKASDLKEEDLVIEIGPGEGVLTEKLASRASKVIAIELDESLAELLRSKLRNKKNLKIINGDILEINIPELLKNNQASSYKIVANIPYYITSPIIKLFLEQAIQPKEMILMVQKEVAERIVALPREIPAENRNAKRISWGKPGQMSILAVAVQYYAAAEILFAVPRESFFPVPEVDSALIKIIPKNKFDREKDKQFFRVVRAGFSARRKTLINNLSNGLHLDKKEISEKIKKSGLSPNSRAQELSIATWKKLAELF